MSTNRDYSRQVSRNIRDGRIAAITPEINRLRIIIEECKRLAVTPSEWMDCESAESWNRRAERNQRYLDGLLAEVETSRSRHTEEYPEDVA